MSSKGSEEHSDRQHRQGVEAWLMESAQLFDNQHAVKTIGLNQDLEKAQRIDWSKAINDDPDFPKYS